MRIIPMFLDIPMTFLDIVLVSVIYALALRYAFSRGAVIYRSRQKKKSSVPNSSYQDIEDYLEEQGGKRNLDEVAVVLYTLNQLYPRNKIPWLLQLPPELMFETTYLINKASAGVK